MRKESDAEFFNCIICKEDRRFYSMGICEHRKVCNYCCLRSRSLYKDKKCPICTTKLDYVFIFESTEKPSFLEIDYSKQYLYEDDEFSENGIYYSSMNAKEAALQLKSFICPIKSCQEGAFENIQTLSLHLTKIHKRQYWYLFI
jgi:hypothetical protein